MKLVAIHLHKPLSIPGLVADVVDTTSATLKRQALKVELVERENGDVLVLLDKQQPGSGPQLRVSIATAANISQRVYEAESNRAAREAFTGKRGPGRPRAESSEPAAS